MLQLILIADFVSITGPGTEVRLYYQRESGTADEFIYTVTGSSGRELNGAYTAFAEKLFHLRLLLQVSDEVVFRAINVEVGPDIRVLLQPIFVQRLEAVDFAVFMGEIADGPQNLLIIFQIRDLVILRKR
ncbi:hypothetical protein D3C74_389550 [compost metagenome]